MTQNHDYTYLISIQQFLQRFPNSRKMDDIFSRGYNQVTDSQTNKRSILKFYSIQTPQQQQPVFENLHNFSKLNNIDGICKLIAYAIGDNHKEIISAFQYDPVNIGEYVKIIKKQGINVIERQQIYLDILQEVIKIINTSIEIGIQFDDINRQTLIVKQNPITTAIINPISSIQTHPNRHIINLFYDQRERQYKKIFKNTYAHNNNNKIYWSAQKIQNQILKGGQYSMQQGQQSIYQLGLLLLDIVYQIQKYYSDNTKNNIKSYQNQSRQDLIPDQIAIHSQNAMSYYIIQKQINTVQRNQILISHRLNYLISSQDSFFKQFGILIKNMIILMVEVRPSLSKIQSQTIKLQEIVNNNKFNRYQQNIMPLTRKERQTIMYNKQSLASIKSTPQQAIHLQSTQTLKNISPSKFISSQINIDSLKQSQNSLGLPNQEPRLSQNPFRKNSNNSASPILYRKQINMPLSTTTITSDANTNKVMERFSSHYEPYRHTVNQNLLVQASPNDNTRNTVYRNQPMVNPIPTRPINQQFINLKQLLQYTKLHHESLRKSLIEAVNQLQQIRKVYPQTVMKKQYIDASVYYGCIDKNSKKQGLGIYVYKLSDIYFGVWKNNALTNGVYLFKNGQSFEGSVQKGGKDGRGIYRYANGNVYDGMWKDDLKHGRGMMIYPSGAKYQGQWMKGKKHGDGIYYYENGTQFRGGFALGKKYGNGIFLFPNGTKVEGFWDNNHLQGLAKIFYFNGDYYEGNLHMSQKSGEGIYRWNNLQQGQIQYKGQFKKDHLQGLAIIKFRNGQIYEGRVQNGRRDGQGSYKYSNGDQFIGQWKNDEKQIGKYKFWTGDEFQGKFKNGQMAFGTMKYKNGQIYQGEFSKGQRHGTGTYSNKLGLTVYQGNWQRDQYISNKKN